MDTQLINDTVRRMIESEIDDDTIITTLKDIGVSEDDAKKIILQNKPNQEEIKTNPELVKKVQILEDNIKAQNEINSMNIESKDVSMIEHSQKIEEIEKKIDEVKKVPNASVDVSVKYRLDEMDKNLSNLKAGVNANLEIMKKILDINREILTELKTKD
jgi:DNA-binding transcriptional MerR regulator